MKRRDAPRIELACGDFGLRPWGICFPQSNGLSNPFCVKHQTSNIYTANPLYSSSLTLKKLADSPAGRVQSLPFCWSVTGEAQSPTDSEPTTSAEKQLALR